ncbi:hypothetical protein L2E82_16443 [Cichorium intybus]|uniref:Uncharacterized protein n=1 Tax=Cichorium intybus TaxID=13427 RepID=A0ACB9F611_CICIN|nr:hypothetical protein L2E82_16443 [Cichorium intybus]
MGGKSIWSQEDVEEQMGRNGGVRKRHILIRNTNALQPRLSPIQSNLMDYRYLQDERSAYFQLNDPYTSQKMNVASSSSDHQNYSHFNFQNLKNQKDEETEGQHCFVMGTDFIKSSEETKSGNTKPDDITTHTNNKQPFHHFFAPPKSNDPGWVDVDQHQNFINQPKSPLSTQDLFQSKPRPYW